MEADLCFTLAVPPMPQVVSGFRNAASISERMRNHLVRREQNSSIRSEALGPGILGVNSWHLTLLARLCDLWQGTRSSALQFPESQNWDNTALPQGAASTKRDGVGIKLSAQKRSWQRSST